MTETKSIELNLPDELTISRPSSLETDDDFDEYISDYLSDEYGFCVNSFNYEFDMTRIYISKINWDTED